jgi:serine/threonine-protein kinase
MRAEDWPRIEELFHAASRLGGAEREAYLARECGGDAALRAEVESLVAALESESGFMERPALSLGLRVLSGGAAKSLAGRSLGHYRVVRMLDSGGMGGEVYLAEDCLLERPVALKFIANYYAGDDWAKGQMMKEARAVARLEHPNICPVYGVEEIDGHHFIVMQYVEGETLAALMRRGRVGTERAAALAGQIAGALAFAHARGVVHRDVKPQNIMVTPDGQARILDFGLARFVRQNRDERREGEDPVQTLQLGGVVGTPAYMSPEQARGDETDFASDIFSFGIVLYEMLSGRNPFLRDTVRETISAILTDSPPPLSATPAGARGALGEMALRCLAKERGQRPGSAEVLARELRALAAARGDGAARRGRESAPTIRRHVGRYAGRYAAAALALLLLLSSLAGYVYLKLSKVHTLAVLPIANQSDDPGKYYLAEGFTRNLFDKFSYLPRLRIKRPSVVPPGSGGRSDLAVLGRRLKADAVLSGRVFRDGQNFLLHLTLLNARDAALVWEGTFNLDAANTFAVQDEITREVSSRLGMWLVGYESRALTRRQTDSEEALNLYMRGRDLWSRRDQENIKAAITHFERAKDLDPSFGQALAGLSDCYALMANVLYGPVPPKEAMDKARWSARKALEADESLPEAHTSMGVVRLRFDWDWREAEREFKRAIELDPEYAPARFWYANLLAARGRFDESLRESEAAREHDPYSPLADVNYGRALYYAGRHDEAAAYLREKLRANPDYPQLLHMLGYVELRRGRIDEAVATFEKLHSTKPLLAAAALGHAYGRAGRDSDALRMISELDELSKTQFVPPLEKALVYIGMGRRDEAFSLLEECYGLRLANLAYLTTDPIYDGIRTDPRFVDLARRVNLTP